MWGQMHACVRNHMQGELMSGMKMLQWCMAALAFLAVVLLGVGAWYTFEVSVTTHECVVVVAHVTAVGSAVCLHCHTTTHAQAS
jgi:hypothetical protein